MLPAGTRARLPVGGWRKEPRVNVRWKRKKRGVWMLKKKRYLQVFADSLSKTNPFEISYLAVSRGPEKVGYPKSEGISVDVYENKWRKIQDRAPV